MALQLNCGALDGNKKNLLDMEEALLGRLEEAGIGYRRNGALEHIPGNLSLSFKGCDGEMLLHRLDLKGICVSTGSACDSKRTQVSHVLQAINLVSDYAMGTIRVSLGRLNTIDDAVTIADAIISIIG